MKKIIIITAVLAISLLPVFTQGQPDPPPNGSSTDQSGSAPIGGGLTILLTLGAAYGGKKYYDYRKKMKNEMED